MISEIDTTHTESTVIPVVQSPQVESDDGKKMARDFFASQNDMIRKMMLQQSAFMKQMGNDAPKDDSNNEGATTSSRTESLGDEVELLPKENVFEIELDAPSDNELWADRNNGDLSTDGEDGDLEVVLSSKYQLMLDQTEEELGDPLSSEQA